MKNKNIFCPIIIFLILTFSVCSTAYSQPPSPPGHGMNGNQSGGGGSAAIDGGSLVLLLSGAGYGLFKLARAGRPKGAEDEEGK